jgi:uncharacterized membrane protein YoaK (UPF0700 family)
MLDGARFFAYATWAIMISLGIMIFSHQFVFLTDNSPVSLAICVLAFGVMYGNFTYAAIKRYIKKVPTPPNTHMLLSALIFAPPAAWLLTIGNNPISINLLIIAVLAGSIVLGNHFGNIRGIKDRYDYVQKLKEYQKKEGEKNAL